MTPRRLRDERAFANLQIPNTSKADFGADRLVLPTHWGSMSLEQACDEFFSGGTPQTTLAEYWGGNIAWTTSSSIEGIYLERAPRTITDLALSNSATRVVPAGNLLVGTRVGVGKAAVNRIDVAISQDLTGCIVRKERFLPEFLAFYLQTPKCQQELLSLSRGATIRGVPREDLLGIMVPAAPLSEQRAIVHALLTTYRAVETQEKIVATLKELKAATMTELLHKGTQGEALKRTKIGEIPHSWELVKLEDVATIERGKFTHRPRNDSRMYGGHIPFIQTGDVANSGGRIRKYRQTLNERGLEVSRVFPKGTIVLTIAANIADTAILEFDSAFPDSLVGITPLQRMDSAFVEAYLRTQKAEMVKLAPKGTQMNINLQFLRPWPVPLPPLAEQQRISGAIRSLDDRLEEALEKRGSLSHLFQSTLQMLMTGEVRLTAEMIERYGKAQEDDGRKTGRVDEKVLQEIVRRIVEAVAPEKIILFGSAVRGEMGPDSDVDLMVVKAGANERELAGELYLKLAGVGVPKDIIVTSPETLDRHKDTIGYIYRDVLREGRIIYDATHA